MMNTEIVLRRSLIGRGFTAEEVRRALGARELVPLRRGAYTRGAEPPDGAARHLLQAHATRAMLSDEAVLSHATAALVHGLPLWKVHLGRVHVTRARGYGGRRDEQVHVHVAPLARTDVVEVDGVRLTSPERTVVDLARTAGFAQAVVVADAALALTEPQTDVPSVSRAELAAALGRAKGWPGVPMARRVLDFADGRSQSVGESRTRFEIAVAGLPAPDLQVGIDTAGGRRTADLGWRRHRVAVEFDGQVKYGRLLRPGQQPGDVVFAEKIREDAIRAAGWTVLRLTWQDLDDPRPFLARLAAHLRGAPPDR